MTETVQLPPAASLPPDKLTVPLPAAAAAVPPQVLLTFGVDATTSPAGKMSVKAIPDRAMVFGLPMAKLSPVVPFSGIELAPKVFVTDGGLATVRFALAVLPVPPLVELTAPVVFVY